MLLLKTNCFDNDSGKMINHEICVMNLCQIIATSVSCLLLICGGLYLILKLRSRYFNMLLCFHNIRSATELILFIINTLELSTSFLPFNQLHNNNDYITTKILIIIPSTFIIFNSILSICFTIILASYHRIIEIKNKTDFLYLSVSLELIVGSFRLYKFSDLAENHDIYELEPFIQGTSGFLLIALTTIDSFTIYKERFKPKNGNSKTKSEQDKIGYKHSISTFYSKILFWWLTPLLWRGYKEPLEPEDLGELREEDSTKSHYDQFLFIYKTTAKAKRSSLWLCYLKSSWKMFTLGGLLKLFGDLSALVGPISIHQIVEYIEQQYKILPLNNTRNIDETIVNNNISINIENKNTNKIYYNINLTDDTFHHDLKIYYRNWNELLSNGWIIAWLVLLASLIQGGLSQSSTHIVNMIGINIKTSLQGLIYRKTLLLSTSCLTDNINDCDEMILKNHNQRKTSYLSANKNTGAITNLMSEDSLNVMSFFWIAHYVWAIPLKIGLVMYLLYLKLGISAIIGSFVCILTMTPLQFLIGKAMSDNSERAAECTDERLKWTNDVFLGIKLIKLNAWEKVFREKILLSRNRELKFLNRDSIYWTFMTFLTHLSSVLITFVTVAVFMHLENENIDILNGNSTIDNIPSNMKINDYERTRKFTASRLFSALALFNQLTVPLFIFPITIPIIISAIVSTRRLERFLQEPEVHKEFEGIRNMARILSKSDASLDMYEKNEIQDNNLYNLNNIKSINENEITEETTIEPSITMASPTPPRSSIELNPIHKELLTPKKTKDLIRNSRIDKSRPRQRSSPSNRDSFQFQTPENIVVFIRNGVFALENSNLLLKIDYLQIPKSKLTIIVGKNGSGKSLLIAALLKEMQQISGDVAWNKYSTIAYVPQVPWLLNSSIRENILFGESFRPKRYEKVLEACALKPDIDIMPEGDMTIIGECGIKLSGGQKQRIVIARSLYSSANVIIMDDPLSSLDNEVAKHVFDNSIRKMLLKANRTVVLVTQRLQLLNNADFIISMKDGYLQCSGSYTDIESKYPEIIFEWNSIMTKGTANDQMSPGKTARERWKLFKNISKISFQKLQTTEQEEPHVSSTQSLYMPSKRRSSVFGSRHLTYELPLPIDECQNEDVIFRTRGSRRTRMCNSLEFKTERKNILRVNSLQPEPIRSDRNPVSRNISSPISLSDSKTKINNNDLKTKSGFRQFLHRMSSRRSNTQVNPKIHRAISASNSIQSISEESHPPAHRLMSESSNSSEMFDDESIRDINDENNFIYDEERKYGEIPTDIYLLYLKSCGYHIVLVFILSTFIWQGLRVYTDVWLRNWTDLENSNETLYYFHRYIFISIVCIIMSIISTPTGQLAGCKARRKLHNHLLNTILSKSINFFQSTPIGRILNRFSNDLSIIDKKIATTSQRLLQFMLLCICAVLINISITFWFILLTIPICASYYIIQKFYRCSSRELQRIESITNSPVISHFTETIQGVTTIRAYSQESRFTEILFKKLEANTIAFIILNTSNRWLGIGLDYLGGVIVFVAIITSLVTVTISNRQNSDKYISTSLSTSQSLPPSPSPSLVGLAINYTLLVPIYLNWVVKLLADMEMYLGAVERIAQYTDCDQVTNKNETIYKSVPISWPQRGDIIFNNVCLRYEGLKQNIIMDLSLRIPAGQRIGICGRTGSGKSSLALSLFSVLDIVEGHILIDDVDLTTVHPDEIRSRLSIIPQDVHLFNVTIRENLDPCGHYSDLELWNCLEMAQLKDVVNSMPLGLDTQITEGGGNLSAGERQLFCLARAILRGSVCLILDEATSSLDTTTELALLEAADKAFQGRTIITIAHRLTTLLSYDRIVVLENGRIVEDGTPKELQENPNSRFLTLLKTGST